MSELASESSARRHPAVTLLDGALDWLDEHRTWFRPERWEHELGIRREFYAQPALELMLTVRSLAAPHRQRAAALAGTALDVAEAVVDSADVRTRLLDRAPRFEEWLFLLTLLHASGHPRPELLDAVQELLDADPDIGPMEHPAAPVARRYILDLGGLRHPMPAMADAACTAMKELDRDVSEYDDQDIYGLTHLLLYAGDFGAVPLPFDVTPARRLVLELLPAQLDRDHDLTAELLACAEMLDLGRDPLVAEGWQALLRARHADGAVPSPPYDPDIEADLTGGVREGYRFATRYHTTLVTVMAATECLR